MNNEVRIGGGWKEKLNDQFSEPYFTELTNFVRAEYQKSTIYPEPKYIFRALDLTPYDERNEVILGWQLRRKARQFMSGDMHLL